MPPAVDQVLLGHQILPYQELLSHHFQVTSLNGGSSDLEAIVSSSQVLVDPSQESDDGGVFGMFPGVDSAWVALLMAIPCIIIMLFTIIGNILVIVSVFTYRPLKNVANMYMVSLAVADIAVSVFVMPFNVIYTLRGKWDFGLFFCKGWVTCDILCCTASILNLCAIALDRYQAIHDPINYAQKRTLHRVLYGIAAVWLLSALISIPPLLGWNDWPDSSEFQGVCTLTSERGFVIYSSFGSFFIPGIIMAIVYAKIFIATRRRLRSRARLAEERLNMRNVNRVPVVDPDNASEFPSSQVVTGGSSMAKRAFWRRGKKNKSKKLKNGPKIQENDVTINPGPSTSSEEKQPLDGELKINDPHSHDDDVHCMKQIEKEEKKEEKGSNNRKKRKQKNNSTCVKVTINEVPSLTDEEDDDEFKLATMAPSSGNVSQVSTPRNGTATNVSPTGSIKSSSSMPQLSTAVSDSNDPSASVIRKSLLKTPSFGMHDKKKKDTINGSNSSNSGQSSGGHKSVQIQISSESQVSPNVQNEFSEATGSSERASSAAGNLSVGYMSGNASSVSSQCVTSGTGSQVSQIWEEKQRISLSRERKAARVLGIVMGVFVACWLPFFLMYVILPFTEWPIPGWLENVITWLGYVNSALNPIIYTIFNRDFRVSFKRILTCETYRQKRRRRQ